MGVLMRRALPCCWLLAIALAALGCGDATGPPAQAETVSEAATAPSQALAQITAGPRDVAVLELGELGSVRIELLPEIAPQTVARFTELAERGFYDGTYFHRVIPGFMIQGGDPNTKNLDPRDDGRGNAGQRVPDEFSDYPHARGTVSMANTGYSNSSSSQFFIVHEDSLNLDERFTVFGRVVDGLETVDAITRLEIDEFGRYGPKNRPYPVNATIERLRIERAEAAAAATRTAAAAPPTPSDPVPAAPAP
jgi:peptidyl-prolyl cis-trans isomerase B (cyclophilin B)